ncbi:MAG: hypothetical protein H6Q00_2060 [Holophagaceae bacterium]|nr:hypothetical protein [Holophagaceae bacterium]
MRLLTVLLATASLGLAAQSYAPDLKRWRLEIKTPLGGWISEPNQEVAFKLVDPRDPNPPKDEAQTFNPYAEEEVEDAPEKTPEELKAERLKREAEAKANAWRNRRVLVWVNGQATTWQVRVGETSRMELRSQNGENRVEFYEPDSGLREIRTWWVSSSRIRLRINPVRSSEEWWNGRLEVLEPGGDLVTAGRRSTSGGLLSYSGDYRHDSPPPGTYTLRWTSGWRGGDPQRIVVEAVLDDGTDQERRWRFEKLQLPGAGPVTLGTFDVEP